MTDSVSFIISRHCVPSDAQGLSPLQHVMIEASQPIRILSAPTGSGKSYAFRRAVVDQQKRVVFVVPTRRLAQNLARALIEELVETGAEATLEEASKRVMLWTSDERRRQEEADPTIPVGHLRVRQLIGLESADNGDMIVATPESVAWFLLKPSRPRGLNSVGIVQLLNQFDHIVFDEFHTIEARGFGLAASVALIAAQVPSGVAKITFLSATPISIKPVLEALGVPGDRILIQSEMVLSGSKEKTGSARAIHGDINVELISDCPSITTILENRISLAEATLEEGRQVVIIYDSVAELLKSKPRLAELCDRLGVGPSERLAINSVDDSAHGRAEDGLFAHGAMLDPMKFKVLIATSSVEIGVTFRAGLMIMDPGFESASLVQRVGRVAREDRAGFVLIRMDDHKPWLRRMKLKELPAETADHRTTIDRFMALTAVASRFDAATGLDGIDPPREFRSLPQRAVWSAALFWAVLETSWPIYPAQRKVLAAFAPKQAAVIGYHLRTLKQSNATSAAVWADRFEAEALCLRMIPSRVRVFDSLGGKRDMPWSVYASHDRLASAPCYFDDKDMLCVHLDDTLEACIGSSERQYVSERVDVLFPDSNGPESVPNSGLADEWLRLADKKLKNLRLSQAGKKALQEAITLVRLSRLVPRPTTQPTAAAAARASMIC